MSARPQNRDPIILSRLEAIYFEIARRGRMRKHEIARMYGSKAQNVEGVLMKLEGAGFLLAEDPNTGEISAWEWWR